VIQNIGSDTMVNVAQAWAEEYAAAEPSVSVEVSGGGSGTGIAALIEGTVDIANCSRQIEQGELEEAVRNTGRTPREFTVGYDALAVYVNNGNSLAEITLQELAEIYGEKGSLTKWSQLGARLPPRAKDAIIVVSRQSNSGTYYYFREVVLGKKRDFRLGTIDMLGSKDVVELVARTPGAVGYSGMGYATPQVKTLRIARQNGEQAYAPTIGNTLSGKYPISRPLFMYTLGEPNERVRKYIDWILSEEGQAILARSGYIPLKAD
jgi:phosphate transport system substrate-binding protein